MIKIPRIIVFFPFSSILVALKTIFTGKIKDGKSIEDFEEAFKKFINVKYAISVSCGKIGLYLSLKAQGAEEGDEIILPSYTVWDVPAVIIAMGMKPVFVDISANDYNLDVKLIKKAITGKTKFILATHLYGIPCDMDSILKIAQEYNLRVIEDCAQSLGAEYKNQKAGIIGDVAYFSFGILKNLNTLGGGMVVTNNFLIAKTIREEVETFSYPKKRYLLKTFLISSLLSLFTSPIFFSIFVFPLMRIFAGPINKTVAFFLSNKPPLKITENFLSKYKYKFTNLQAVIGLGQLKNLAVLNDIRVKNALRLESILKDTNKISIPNITDYTRPIYLNYVVQVPENKRQEIIKKLAVAGIDITFGFLDACADMEEFGKFKTDCPISRRIKKANLYIPVQPPLREKHMEYIANNIKEILKTIG